MCGLCRLQMQILWLRRVLDILLSSLGDVYGCSNEASVASSVLAHRYAYSIYMFLYAKLVLVQ
jgi:hypothetical protein